MVMAIAAMPISPRPVSAAWCGFSPRCRWRWMFSSTTIESSTRMPIISARAIRLMMLRLKPSAYMTRNVLIRLVGMASSTITVCRHAYVVGYLQRIGVGLLDDLQTHGIDAVEPQQLSLQLVRELDRGHVTQENGTTRGGLADDEVRQVVDGLEGPQRSDVQRRDALIYRANRRVDVGVGHGGRDVRQGDAVRRELGIVHPDLNLGLLTAGDVDCRDTR